MRYFWYGYHPYYWYGYDPIPQQPYYTGGDTYNYYTYNYNTYGSTGTTSDYTTSNIPAVNENTFADVRAKMQQQVERTPDAATLADQYFDEAVRAFEINAFYLAAEKFAEAMKLAPNDMILPFAYAQTLLAVENYTRSAEVLRAALIKVTPDKEGVFYPRGLYENEDILTDQIKILKDKAKLYPLDADLQLILGYQMLGLGELDEAGVHLNLASGDIRNAPAANVLLNLLAKMKAKIETSTNFNSNLQSDSQPTSDYEWLPMDMITQRFELWKSQYWDTFLFAFFRYA
jgi:predicted Zn-dependent protease